MYIYSYLFLCIDGCNYVAHWQHLSIWSDLLFIICYWLLTLLLYDFAFWLLFNMCYLLFYYCTYNLLIEICSDDWALLLLVIVAPRVAPALGGLLTGHDRFLFDLFLAQWDMLLILFGVVILFIYIIYLLIMPGCCTLWIIDYCLRFFVVFDLKSCITLLFLLFCNVRFGFL